ncbi:MAG: hypothetical protein IJR93_02990 [Treponema sp.]|nr:hypothetical protein [Treponema sp.]
MEDNYETTNNSVTSEELIAYIESHSVEEIIARGNEFLGYFKNLCRSMSALYNEYIFPLLALGIRVTVDMHSAASGKTERIAVIGFSPEAEKILKEGKDGGE